MAKKIVNQAYNFTEEQKRTIQTIRSLEIKLRKKVNQTFAGEHLSAFKGQGMEFSEVRKYVRGDDAKNIEWKITARTNSLHVKNFQEERELVFNILFDISKSTIFGSGNISKKEVATEIAATLAFASIKNRDKIGFLSFTDLAEHYLPPKKGKAHAFKIIRESLFYQPVNQKSNLKNALQFFAKMQKKPSVLFVFSDFLFTNEYQDLLRQLSLKHSIIVFHIQDSLELSLPNLGFINFNDLESGQTSIVNTHSKEFRERYKSYIFKRNLQLQKKFREMKTKYLAINTGEDYFKTLSEFFKKQIIR